MLRLFELNVPYLFHTSLKGMEGGNRCGTRLFHTFHTFHTCSPRTREARMQAQARTHTPAHTLTPNKNGMEGMEGMEEGHRTRVFGSIPASTPCRGMEPKEAGDE